MTSPSRTREAMAASQRAYRQKRREAESGKEVNVYLKPATVTALAQLRARGAKSDAAAVNDAIQSWAEWLAEPSDIIIPAQMPTQVWKR